MTSAEADLEEQLKEAGNKLLSPPSSIDELLNLLDKAENLLANVEQAPSESKKDALLPSMKALITNELLRHADIDVKVSVASCITEIMRITAPDAPYNDEQMKEIFQLTVVAFEKLSDLSSRCYMKAVSMLETVAKVRSCLVMLDLECDALVVEMFENFFKSIRFSHPDAVVSSMEAIMTMVIEESEEISFDLLGPLLASVKKENQTVSPISWKLGEKVMSNCAVKLKDCLKETVQSMDIALDDYSEIVTSICKTGPDHLEHEPVNDSEEHFADENKLEKRTDANEPPRTDLNKPSKVTEGLASDTVCPTKVGQPVDGTVKLRMRNSPRNDDSSKSLQHSRLTKNSKSTGARSNADSGSLQSTFSAKSAIERVSAPKKRGRKPNSLMNPEEGYDHSWISTGNKTRYMRRLKPHDRGVDDSPPENLNSEKATELPEDVTEPSGFQTKTNEIGTAVFPSPDQSLSEASHRRRGRPKKKGNMENQDADPNSLSRSEEKVVEKASQSADIRRKRKSEVTSTSDAKPQGLPKRIRIAIKTNEETTVAPGCVVPKNKVAVTSVPEEKPLKLSAMNAEKMKDRSSTERVVKKRKRDDATSEKDITEASSSKMVSKSGAKSTNRDDSYSEETPKKKLRRTRTATKEESSEEPELDERLVGSRIRVWWPLDKMFYEGVINSYDAVKKKHQVLYADGDEEILNLRKERWELVGDNILPGSQETDLPEPEALADIRQKSKGKAKSAKSKSAKREKVDSSSKRSAASAVISKVDPEKSGGNSSDDPKAVISKVDLEKSGGNSADDPKAVISKLDPEKSGGNSADEPKAVKPIAVNESVDAPSRMDDRGKDEGHKHSPGKLSIEKLKPSTSLKQYMPRTTTLPKGFL